MIGLLKQTFRDKPMSAIQCFPNIVCNSIITILNPLIVDGNTPVLAGESPHVWRTLMIQMQIQENLIESLAAKYPNIRQPYTRSVGVTSKVPSWAFSSIECEPTNFLSSRFELEEDGPCPYITTVSQDTYMNIYT